MVYHLIFSFPKLLFIEYHTIISEVCFNNREFHSSILGAILGVILCFLGVIWGVILNFLSTFGGGAVYFIEFLSTMFRNLSIVSLFWGWYLFENLSWVTTLQ